MSAASSRETSRAPRCCPDDPRDHHQRHPATTLAGRAPLAARRPSVGLAAVDGRGERPEPLALDRRRDEAAAASSARHDTASRELRARRLGVGPDRAVRVRRELGDQHRERVLRRAPDGHGLLALVRRARVRTQAGSRVTRAADHRRRAGARLGSWLSAVARVWFEGVSLAAATPTAVRGSAAADAAGIGTTEPIVMDSPYSARFPSPGETTRRETPGPVVPLSSG